MDLAIAIFAKWAVVVLMAYLTLGRVWRAWSRARADGRPLHPALKTALLRLVWSVVVALLSAGGMLLNIEIRGPNPKWLDNSLIAIFLLSCVCMAIAIAQVGNRAREEELSELAKRG